MAHIQATINEIINEIKQINHINNNNALMLTTDDGSSNNSNDNDDCSTEEFTQLIESITTCTSIDEFAKSVAVEDNLINNDNQTQINDHELLSMIGRHAKHMKIVPYDKVPQACQINVDVEQLSRVKKQIEASFVLINEEAQRHEYDGQIIAFNSEGGGISSFSLETLKWTPIETKFEELPENSYHSSVYARGSIYSFGGLFLPNVYTRYSLAEKKLYQSYIVGANGGFFISVCFDGEKYIYLVGGADLDNEQNIVLSFDRVDRFNIETEQFQHVEQHLNFGPMAYSTTFFHNNLLYIVNGYDISSFNVQTRVHTKITTHEVKHHTHSCYDGIDNVYTLSKSQFTRYTLSTKRRSQLRRSPINLEHLMFVYDGTGGILIIGGTGKNHRYSFQDNTWTLLNDNDTVVKRLMDGICLIRD
ncbi:hypothetical protein SAMD00019534_090480 [Acytostelium subglobosum LB1]|uniref:hypothetical protein n=1 Tax=Acytostelium subglobosum LB1 TaxID=1410327 RepID=UPI000644999E|nr:hypothetical protein SAMD00019534_090480 [Acytostelium subglobosum LB1]GAM25873.1 hypothetical protein SAMD00019534_090480 [Acytostelium subglobosum LB1]|eukprot:XP_012751391.1 hypothetical protein SAMD00019534_090480 [Acytostelium subglobosum LB1]